MADRIKLTPSELKSQAAQMRSLETEFSALFGNVVSELNRVNGNWSSNLAHNFSGKISSAQNKFKDITRVLSDGAQVASTCSTTFESVDSALGKLMITGIYGGTRSDTPMWQAAVAAGMGAAAVTGTTDDRSWFAKFLNNDLKVDGALLSGAKTGAGKFLGFNTSGTVKGDLLAGEAGIKTKASWGFDEKTGKWSFKKFGISTEASASGALAQGEASGNIGYLHGKIGGKAVTAGVSAEAKATIWDDGKLNPSLMVGAKAEGSVLQGEAEVGFGDDQYGVYAKADGDLLHAEAEAGVGVGYIGKDKNGKAMYGAKAEASAMACVAQGKVKGGVTIFGIDIDVGVKGYAAAAGVEAGGTITTNGVTGSFGGALGLGAGVDISVDWSDAKWIGEAADAVGDFANDAVDFAKDTAENIADAAKGFAEGAAEAAGDVGDFLFGWIK